MTFRVKKGESYRVWPGLLCKVDGCEVKQHAQSIGRWLIGEKSHSQVTATTDDAWITLKGSASEIPVRASDVVTFRKGLLACSNRLLLSEVGGNQQATLNTEHLYGMAYIDPSPVFTRITKELYTDEHELFVHCNVNVRVVKPATLGTGEVLSLTPQAGKEGYAFILPTST